MRKIHVGWFPGWVDFHPSAVLFVGGYPPIVAPGKFGYFIDNNKLK